MASDTATRNAERASTEGEAVDDARGRRAPVRSEAAKGDAGQGALAGAVQLVRSRLTQLILAANLAGLIILISGVFLLAGARQGLVDALAGSLTNQGGLIANAVGGAASEGEPVPRLVPSVARIILRNLFESEEIRVRLFDVDGDLIADSFTEDDEVQVRALPPPRPAGQFGGALQDDPDSIAREAARAALQADIRIALQAETVVAERRNEQGERVLRVVMPIQRVQAVLGVITLESGAVNAIIAAERRSLAPFVLIAVGVTVITSALLTLFIALPVRRLAAAADRVRREGPRRASIPDLSSRQDEIGELSHVLAAMTRALSDRIDAIERFAADVAHELKNPLTSIRSAVETFPAAKTDQQRERLLGVMRHDVVRIDRLITDISRASRVDAELARAAAERVDVSAFIAEIVELYSAIRREKEVEINYMRPDRPVYVDALRDQLSQVVRNLIDNAMTFSTAGAHVDVTVSLREDDNLQWAAITVEDNGPGVPQENLERIFERFYTERPDGAAFGSHSGLGLAIARQIVEAHGGRIWAENRADGQNKPGGVSGARFIVALPHASA